MSEEKAMNEAEAEVFYEQWVDDSGKYGMNKCIIVPYYWGYGSHNKPICVLEFDLLFSSYSYGFKFHARPAIRGDIDHHIKVYHNKDRVARVELVINEKAVDVLILELTRIKEAILNNKDKQ